MNEEIVESVKKLVSEFPNDTDLGREVRKYFLSIKEVEQEKNNGIWDFTNGY